MPESSDPAKSSAALISLVYGQLRSLAASYMRRERPGHTLQATALVHEAYMALASKNAGEWQGKTHFMATAALQMRRVLVDHARRRNAQVRGGRYQHVQLDERIALNGGEPIDILALSRALDELSKHSPKQSLVVQYIVFGGLTHEEIAHMLHVSERTVRNYWTLGRGHLVQSLDGH
jgi:RNA polymerase sigma factor (TIGR02999 family)